MCIPCQHGVSLFTLCACRLFGQSVEHHLHVSQIHAKGKSYPLGGKTDKHVWTDEARPTKDRLKHIM